MRIATLALFLSLLPGCWLAHGTFVCDGLQGDAGSCDASVTDTDGRNHCDDLSWKASTCRWVPLDATLGRGGIGGGHLKLLTSNLEGFDAYGAFLPVFRVLGRLELEVLEVE